MFKQIQTNFEVGDVAWAPYSSTVFAAVTVDGKAIMYIFYDSTTITNAHLSILALISFFFDSNL